MASSKAFPEADPILQLLTAYSFDTGNHYQAEALVVNWLQQFEPAWINQAITEALYQGRYKMVSVDHILQLWRRRGQPLRHYNREFESIILGAGLYQAPGLLPPRPITPPSRAIPPLSTWLRTVAPAPSPQSTLTAESPHRSTWLAQPEDAAPTVSGPDSEQDPRPLDDLAAEGSLQPAAASDQTLPSVHNPNTPDNTEPNTWDTEAEDLDAGLDHGVNPSTDPDFQAILNSEADLAEDWPDPWATETKPDGSAIAEAPIDQSETIQTSLDALSASVDCEPKIPKFRPVPSASKPQSDGIPPFVPQPAPSELNQRLQAVVKAGQESS